MQATRDAIFLLVLILLAVSVRVTPLEKIVDLIPESHAATAARTAEGPGAIPAAQSSSGYGESCDKPRPGSRPRSPSPMGTLRPLRVEGTGDSRVMVLIEVERDRRQQAPQEQCPSDPDRPRKAPAAGAAC